MKALCVCHYGHSRSVALVRRLHHRGIEAVAAGAFTAGPSCLETLSAWATHIFLMEPHFVEQIPQQHRHKVVVFNVGPDRWSNPYNQELLNIVDGMFECWVDSNAEPR